MQPNRALINRLGIRLVAMAAPCLAVAACQESRPSGQVLARVGGEDITITELEHEQRMMFDGSDTSSPSALLETVVLRKALAQLARQRDLEQDPTYHFELRRTREQLLVDALYRRLASQIAQPSASQITDFERARPWQFSKRRILSLSEVGTSQGPDETIDTITLSSEPAFPIMTVSPGQKILWRGKVRYVTQVLEAPMEGDAARKWASERLVADAVQREVARLYSGVLESGRLQYAPGYGPSGISERIDGQAKTAIGMGSYGR